MKQEPNAEYGLSIFGSVSDNGCRYARLATGNYQAPAFYQKLGYTLYGTLEHCPPGETAFYFWKLLV
jgi:ribosomal protein S18 acetylase RimI-like enzyme